MGRVQGAHRGAGRRPPDRLSSGAGRQRHGRGQPRRDEHRRVHAQRDRRRGARRRFAARRVAGASRHQVGEGRLQPAGPVRVLHGVGRRPAPRRVRHAGRSRRRPRRHDARGPRRRRPLGRVVLRQRREPVRLLHARDHHACRRPHRSHRCRGAPRPPRPPVPLHRLAPHRHLRSVCFRSAHRCV